MLGRHALTHGSGRRRLICACTERVHRLICGDCLTVLPTLDAESVDVVVTSPPYNLGTDLPRL